MGRNFDAGAFVADVKQVIDRHGWTAKSLGERAGVHPFNVQQILRRGSVSDVQCVAGLARACDLVVDDYIEWPIVTNLGAVS